MKRSFYLFAFVLSCVLNSCTQDAEVVYSCNEEINEWTIENLSMIQEMTRSEWLKLDENKKRAAYRGFTQQQRINFWIEKIEENMARDKRNDMLLEQLGWVHLHFWEKEVLKQIDACIETIMSNI